MSMGKEEQEAIIERIRSFCGKIDDETFVEPYDAYPSANALARDDEDDFVKTINELCGSITDEAFRRYPEVPLAV